MGETREIAGQLVPGTLDMLILKTLNRGRQHGYGIARLIQETSREVLKVEESALYPALHRLEVRGMVRSQWGVSDNNRRAKYYQLTALGRRELEREAENWRLVAGAVALVMRSL